VGHIKAQEQVLLHFWLYIILGRSCSGSRKWAALPLKPLQHSALLLSATFWT